MSSRDRACQLAVATRRYKLAARTAILRTAHRRIALATASRHHTTCDPFRCLDDGAFKTSNIGRRCNDSH